MLLICHAGYLLPFLCNFCKSWRSAEILLECLRVNGYKWAVLNPEGNDGAGAESKGPFSYAEAASEDGGGARSHSSLPEDNLSS